MKYSEAKKQIEALSSKYNAYKDKETDFFNVNYKNAEVAYVQTSERYSFRVWVEKHFQKLPFSNKLYMILAELAMTPLEERKEDKKYYTGLPVIPKAVGEYIEDAKASHYELLDAMTKWTLDQPVYDWINDNSDTFARAWLDGYEIDNKS